MIWMMEFHKKDREEAFLASLAISLDVSAQFLLSRIEKIRANQCKDNGRLRLVLHVPLCERPLVAFLTSRTVRSSASPNSQQMQLWHVELAFFFLLSCSFNQYLYGVRAGARELQFPVVRCYLHFLLFTPCLTLFFKGLQKGWCVLTSMWRLHILSVSMSCLCLLCPVISFSCPKTCFGEKFVKGKKKMSRNIV